LLLSGNPHKHWTVKGVYDVVKSSIPSVQTRLKEFAEAGILKVESGTETYYQFSPNSDRIWRVVNELREAYKERPVKIVEAIYSKPPEGVEEFAKAFRLRKETDG
jgi:sugar phosphate isomerase/epimerase